MILRNPQHSKYDRRIARAEFLATKYPFAQEPLRFYRGILQFQKNALIKSNSNDRDLIEKRGEQGLRAKSDLTGLLPNYESFLAIVQTNGPSELAKMAAD